MVYYGKDFIKQLEESDPENVLQERVDLLEQIIQRGKNIAEEDVSEKFADVAAAVQSQWRPPSCRSLVEMAEKELLEIGSLK